MHSTRENVSRWASTRQSWTPLMSAPKANVNDTFALVYGSVTLLGGIIGYLKANSTASYSLKPLSNDVLTPVWSLLSSTLIGGTIFYATTQLPPSQSARVMLAVGVLLSLFFGPRFVQTWKIMPAGLMTVLRYSHLSTEVNCCGFAIFKYSKEVGLW